jgi:hypothetical protein
MTDINDEHVAEHYDNISPDDAEQPTADEIEE